MPLDSGRKKNPTWNEFSKQIDESWICNHCKETVTKGMLNIISKVKL